MATLWIDPNLVIRWHPNGWPDINRWHPGHGMKQDYLDTLAQAKAESVPVITNYAGEMMDRIGNREFKPDSFIELAGEVEVVWQHKVIIGGGWVDCSEEHYNSQHESFPHIFRKVARLKPALSDTLDRLNIK